jgi:hypothetical protein
MIASEREALLLSCQARRSSPMSKMFIRSPSARGSAVPPLVMKVGVMPGAKVGSV